MYYPAESQLERLCHLKYPIIRGFTSHTNENYISQTSKNLPGGFFSGAGGFLEAAGGGGFFLAGVAFQGQLAGFHFAINLQKYGHMRVSNSNNLTEVEYSRQTCLLKLKRFSLRSLTCDGIVKNKNEHRVIHINPDEIPNKPKQTNIFQNALGMQLYRAYLES